MNTVNASKLKYLIDSRFHLFNILDENIKYKDPTELLSPARIDVAVKIKYIKSLKDRIPENIYFYRKLYKSTIEYFSDGLFYEPGDSHKNNFNDFDNYFMELLESLSGSGFNKTKSIIPLSKNNVPLDGAHRIAIAHILNIKLPTIRLDIEDPSYNINFFKNKGATEKELLEYTKCLLSINKNTRIAILWPYNDLENKKINNLFGENIIYSGSLNLSLNGVRNLCLVAYNKEKWIGTPETNWHGIPHKADSCFKKNRKTRFIVFNSFGQEKDISIKEQIRNLTDSSKNNIHTTDNFNETKEISELLLNKDSELLLNNINRKNLSSILLTLKNNVNDFSKLLIGGSSILHLLNLRNSNDIDLLHFNDIKTNEIIGSHNCYLNYYGLNEKNLANIEKSTDLYFNILGINFITINKILDFKKRRSEEKDKKDIILLKKFQSGAIKESKLREIKGAINKSTRIFYFKNRNRIVKLLKKTILYSFIKNNLTK
jgi:hypothetical protein